MTMAVIGTFKLGKNGGWTGHVRTLTLDTRLRLVPNDDRDHDDAPAFRVLIGGSCIADAWEQRSRGEEAKEYIRVKFDDPALPALVIAALFPSHDGTEGQLVWRRAPRDRSIGASSKIGKRREALSCRIPDGNGHQTCDRKELSVADFRMNLFRMPASFFNAGRPAV
jgi:uncharacterized protein (DUF736 family)